MENIRVSSECGKVSLNFEEAKAFLEGQLANYQGIIFTEDTKKDAKNTVADLRKQKKAFSDKVKEVKKEYCLPLDNFLAQAKQLEAMFDEPINFITTQIEDFEAKRIAEKKEAINQAYLEVVPEELRTVVVLSKIYDSKWENATTTLKQIKDDMSATVCNARSAVETIKAMNSEMETKAIVIYSETFDLAQAINFIHRYEAEKKEILERERERTRLEEEERIRREERERIKAEEEKQKAIEEALKAQEEALAKNVEEVMADDVPFDTEPISDDEEPFTVEEFGIEMTYHLVLTATQREKLEAFLKANNIEYFI